MQRTATTDDMVMGLSYKNTDDGDRSSMVKMNLEQTPTIIGGQSREVLSDDGMAITWDYPQQKISGIAGIDFGYLSAGVQRLLSEAS